MIGNDIVDRALARKESHWQRKGFLHKIFTSHEQQLIRTAADPDQMVWLLWSMKESAYKISVRESGKRSFAPIKLVCSITALNARFAKGIVRHEENEYLTQSLVTGEYIASAAVSDKHHRIDHVIVSGDEPTYPQQQAVLWQKVKQHFAATRAVPAKEICFHKDESGAPWMTLPPAEKVPLSVSHHGHFGAFVIGHPSAAPGQ